MKIKPEHLDHIKKAIQPHDNDFHRSRYAMSGYSDERYRWDLVRHAGLMTWICDTLYPYMNDGHIDTALRRVVRPLERKGTTSVSQ